MYIEKNNLSICKGYVEMNYKRGDGFVTGKVRI